MREKLIKRFLGDDPMERLVPAIYTFGNVYDLGDEKLSVWDIDAFIPRLKKWSTSNEWLMFLDKNLVLQVDDMLGVFNAGHEGAVSFGAFDNSKSAAIESGFNGFSRGEYSFYYTAIPGLKGGILIPNDEFPSYTSKLYIETE